MVQNNRSAECRIIQSGGTIMRSGISADNALARGILSDMPMSYLGFGLYQAWYWMLHSTSRLYPLALGDSFELTSMRVTGLAIHVAMLLALFLYVQQSAARREHPAGWKDPDRWAAASGALGTAATIAIMLASLLSWDILAWAGWVLWGLVSAPLVVTWIRLYSTSTVRELCFLISGSFAIGAITTYALCYIPLGPSLTVSALLPLLSAGLGRQARNLHTADEPDLGMPVTPPSPRFSYVVRLLIVICLFALIYNALVAPLGTRRGAGFETNNGYMLLAPLTMSMLFIAIVRFTQSASALNRIFRAILPVTVLGLLILPFAQGASLSLAGLIAASGFECFSIVYWALLSDAAACNRLAPFKVLLLGRVVYGAGIVGGTCFSIYLSAFDLFRDKEFFTFLCLASVMVLVVLGTVFLHDREILEGQTASSESDAGADTASPSAAALPAAEDIFLMKAERITTRYGLTPRECEVFTLLAKGRSNKLIQERLFISAHTVDSHVTHIYRKCDVHSRQEIMDLIEQEEVEVTELMSPPPAK